MTGENPGPCREPWSVTLSSTLTPNPADKFTFGLWTVGWQGRDPFGDATRPALDPVETVHRLAELGAYGVTFHDDDLIPFGSTDAERAERIEPLPRGAGRDRAAGADGHHQPVHPPGVQGRRASPRTTATSAATRCARPSATSTSPSSSAPRSTSPGAGARAPSPVRPRTCASRSTASRRPSTCSASTSPSRATTIRFAIEPKPNEPRGDILLPTVGHALAFINSLERPELVGLNPEVGHEQMAGLNFPHGIAQALWHGKLFHIDLNGQSGIKYDQDLRFGAGDLRAAFWLVDLLESAGYQGPRHFDFKPPRTEDFDGVWASAAGCMRNYLILRERAAAFRADPAVQEALKAARLDQLALTTLAPGEKLADLLADRSAFEDFDVEAAAARGMAFEQLDQLAMDHLLGA